MYNKCMYCVVYKYLYCFQSAAANGRVESHEEDRGLLVQETSLQTVCGRVGVNQKGKLHALVGDEYLLYIFTYT